MELLTASLIGAVAGLALATLTYFLGAGALAAFAIYALSGAATTAAVALWVARDA